MSSIAEILTSLSHRPWKLPEGDWRYYQEWNNALFLHWRVPVEEVRPFIPEALEVDTINGATWVSLVAFTMERIRHRLLPAVGAISNFHELNLRAYVTKDNKPGVYFLSMEGQKYLSVLIAKSLSGLPYVKARMSRNVEQNVASYVSHNRLQNFNFDAQYVVGAAVQNRLPLDSWLTERYCLYMKEGSTLYRYDVHHKMWDIHEVEIKKLSMQYQIGQLQIKDKKPDLAHFSKGVKVLAWRKERV